MLSQKLDWEERVVSFASRSSSKAVKNYCATKREPLAVVNLVCHHCRYMYGATFMVQTDPAALKWLMGMKEPEGQLARRFAPSVNMT